MLSGNETAESLQTTNKKSQNYHQQLLSNQTTVFYIFDVQEVIDFRLLT